MGETKKGKKTFKMPHSLVIMVIIIFAATAMTWLIPAGEFARVENADGVSVVDPDSFRWLERSSVSFLLIPYYIILSLEDRASLMYATMFAGAAFHMIAKSGALQVAVGGVSRKIQNRSYIFIPVMTTLFAVICATQAVNHFIAFSPLMVVIALAMGYDSITGVAIILLGGAVGYSTAGLNFNSAILAQQISGVPLYSGLPYRAVCFVVYLVVTNIYLVRYVMKITKDPAASYVYDIDQKREERTADFDSFGTMDLRKILIIISLIVTLVGIIVGNMGFGWDLEEDAAWFLACGVIMGFILGLTPSQIASEMVKGCKSMLGAAMLIGVAGAIAGIMEAGNITDTIVWAAGQALSYAPDFLMGPAMFLVNVLIAMVIVFASGMATATMPIMAPLADIFGITRQTAVLSFTIADGFCNYILPHSSALMGILGAGDVPYDRWMKFMGKLFIIWVITGCILVAIAQMMKYGPV